MRNFKDKIKEIIESHSSIREKFYTLIEEGSKEGYLEGLSKECEEVCEIYQESYQNRNCLEDLQHASIAVYYAAQIAEYTGLECGILNHAEIGRLYNKVSEIVEKVSEKATDPKIREFSAFLRNRFADEAVSRIHLARAEKT